MTEIEILPELKSEEEINLAIATVLDAERLAIPTAKGALTLRQILTAVFQTQELDQRWLSKIFGKRKVNPQSIVLHLPENVGKYINLAEGGKYLGFYNQIVDSLELLVNMNLLNSMRVFEFSEEIDDFEHADTIYGVTRLGKVFVSYGSAEDQE